VELVGVGVFVGQEGGDDEKEEPPETSLFKHGRCRMAAASQRVSSYSIRQPAVTGRLRSRTWG
jgi:hypothetical protein